MTNNRFWKIVDKYEVTTDHADGMEVSVPDVDSAIKEIVYYNRGDSRKSIADFGLLVKGYPDEHEQFNITKVCDEYNCLGMKEFKKKYKNIFTNN
jgi:hypothetical protein